LGPMIYSSNIERY